MIDLPRRQLLRGLFMACMAPAIVRASSLMAISPVPDLLPTMLGSLSRAEVLKVAPTISWLFTEKFAPGFGYEIEVAQSAGVHEYLESAKRYIKELGDLERPQQDRDDQDGDEKLDHAAILAHG